MPSTKSPVALQVGSGKVPNNTVSNSALTSVPGSTVASPPPPINVVNVTTTTTLTRLGQFMVVLVNATGGGFNITLPTTSQVGDVITFVMTTTSTNVVNIARGGADTIQSSANSQALAGAYTSRSLVRSSLTDWTFEAETPSVQTVTTSLTLTRGGKERIVLVDPSGGAVTLTLPQLAHVGDRVTIVKSVASANSVTVDGNGGDTIDGRLTTVMNTFLQALVLVRIASGAWATVSETSSVIEVNDTLSLAGIESAKEIHLLVHTSNGAWIAGTKTLTLPSSATTRVGQVITISDVDGNAEVANITIASQILGTSPSGTAAYTLNRNFAALTLINKSSGNWTILDEDRGLVPNFFVLSRADNRVDISQSRLAALPQFNWSHRKVALHAEFNGLITNMLPVEGFSAGGSMTLATQAGTNGTVGVMRTTVTAGASGYLHWGSLPTSDVFDPAQLLGFRAVLSPVTANPGTDYALAVGFGDDVSDMGGSIDQRMGANSLYLITGSTGFWRRCRQSGGSGTGTNSAFAVAAGNRYVLEYYNDGTNWDLYVNDVRSVGGSTNKPTAMLNFGMQVLNLAGASDYVVDVDSFTVFTLDLGNTRHNP